MLRKIFILFFCFFATSNSQIVTYKDILRSAFNNSLELKNIILEKKMATIDKDIVFYEYLPNISLGYNFKLTKKDAQIDTYEYRQYRNSLSMDIVQKFNYFEQSNKLEIANYDINLIDLKICDLKKEIAFKVLDLYSELIVVKNNLQYFTKMETILKKIVDQKQKLYKEGILSKNDIITSTQKLLENNIQLNQMQLQYNILLNTFVRDFKYIITKTDKIEVFKIEENTNYANINKLDYINEFKNYPIQLNKNSSYIELIKSQSMPSFEIYFNKEYFYENEKYSDLDFINKNALDDYVVGFNFRFNLNNYFINNKQIERKRLEAKVIKNKKMIDQEEYLKKYEQSNSNIYNLLKNKYENEKLLVSINNELNNFDKLNKSGLEYLFKVYELQLKKLQKEIELFKFEIDISKNYKNFEILFEKENICTLR